MPLFKFSQRFDGYWYRGTQFVYLKLHAIEPSSAINNAKEFVDVMLDYYGYEEKLPPLAGVYADDGPKHITNLISVKTAIMAI